MIFSPCDHTAERKSLAPFLSLIVAVLLVVPFAAQAQDPFPTQVKDVKMGASMSAVIHMIEGVGTHDVKPLPLPGRKALVWTLPTNPYYSKMLFDFTEKDRLFLIRFNLKNLSFRDARGIKKALFEKYGISWDSPWTMKIKESDALMYGPPTQGKVYFFELTDPKTGEKAMELMDVSISKEDRPLKPLQKNEKRKNDQQKAGVQKTESPTSKSERPVPEQKQSVPKIPSQKGDDNAAKAEKVQPK